MTADPLQPDKIRRQTAQRAEWRKALAAAAAARRNARYRRAAPRLRPGMLRTAGQRTATETPARNR